MKEYSKLIEELWSTEMKLLQLKEDHKKYVVRHLIELEQKLAEIKITLIWCATDNFNLDKANYSVNVYSDNSLMFVFIIDSYNPVNFQNFQNAFKETTHDFIATKKLWLELQDEVKSNQTNEVKKTKI